MKRLFLLFLVSFFVMPMFGGEPGHHLHKTLEQIKREFTELEFSHYNGDDGLPVYAWQTSNSYTYFIFKDGQSVREGHIFKNATDLELQSQFRLLVSEFTTETTPRDIKNMNTEDYKMVIFYYSYFMVGIQYFPHEYTIIEFMISSYLQ